MEAISNKITDWLKVFSYVLVFLFVVCSFTNTDYFYGLTIISFVSCIFGYLLFALINKIIKT
jgi:hypothetical protein